ncbi:PepSY domain-containing protein [Paenibacillus sp. JNUCC32]|uniref:PepSY domain-containing protein n=1 Tax=Paenibacillus sp. JNUCC32 TaxID=2777984 RepID=UPI0017879FED|nr:PepSY domain-containing protein [Paenibacillus sp. JNUCC-32]QOT09720.1 PepSY domain-containing protein [Paenibacillus sp. JNUCC-32]
MRKKVSVLLGVIIVVAFMIIVNAVWSPFTRSTEAMSQEEAVSGVLKQYPDGEITKATLDGEMYRMELESNSGRYEMTVDARQGDIVSIKQLDKAPAKPEPEPGETKQPTDNPSTTPAEPAENGEKGSADGESGTAEPPATMITKEYAIKLSLEKVPGTVEDVEYRESKSSRYYLVEIEREDGREATIQVHAITGKIMTVTWDDEDDDE